MREYRPIPTGIKLNDLKSIFSMIAHTIDYGYIDSFGVVTGQNKNMAYLTRYIISDKAFVEMFKHTIMDFDKVYEVVKSCKNKSSMSFGYEDDKLVSIKCNDTDQEEVISAGEGTVSYTSLFPKYTDPDLFKRDNDKKVCVSTVDFMNAISEDYVFTDGIYVITREAVPKPKKIISATYFYGDKIIVADSEFVNFTTLLAYDNMMIEVVSRVIVTDD